MDEKTCTEIRRRESESKVTVLYYMAIAGDRYLYPHFCLPFNAKCYNAFPFTGKCLGNIISITTGKKSQ
jgi:hypothetical protein